MRLVASVRARGHTRSLTRAGSRLIIVIIVIMQVEMCHLSNHVA